MSMGVKLNRIEALLAQILERLPFNPVQQWAQAQDVEPSAPKADPVPVQLQDVVKRGPGRPRKA